MKKSLKELIDFYRNSTDQKPVFVDFSSMEKMEEFMHSYYTLKKESIFNLGKVGTELPSTDDIYEFLGSCNDKEMIITGLGSLLKLYGVNFFRRYIHSLLNATYSTKFIFITYQCAKFFDEKVPKLRDNIIVSDEVEDAPSSLVFISKNFNDKVDVINGLKQALLKLENTISEKIYVATDYTIRDFPDSLLKIEGCKTAYDLICLKDSSFKHIPKEFGSEQQWEQLLLKLNYDTVESIIKEYIDFKFPISNLKEWTEKSPFTKWLTFLYFKMKNLKTDNWSVDFAIDKAKNERELISEIYNSLSTISYKEPEFWNKYRERKRILRDINDEYYANDYCSRIRLKNGNAIYYLTDNTDFEKKCIIETIVKYHDSFNKNVVLTVLEKVYPDLYNYLADYNYGITFISEYFNNYKYYKVTNVLAEEFKKRVDKEARERTFKRDLKTRSETLQELDYSGALIYFIDALGAEYLSFIERKCKEKGLICRTKICRANLPSITSKNVEFREKFLHLGIDVIDIKELDNIKHEGKEEYDFEKNKYPFYIIAELKVISDCIDNLCKKIRNGSIKKGIIVSDHGATRLAILNNDMVREDVQSVGEHGGRVCKEIPNMIQIPNAIIEDGYCILADYNAFKGGRIGKVEMHGGATLEEVTVPVIEIMEDNSSIDVHVVDEVIKVSYKTKATLKFICKVYEKELIVKVNGKNYRAESQGSGLFVATLDDIEKSGSYTFEVWNNNQIISTGNVFEIEKEAAKTNNLWS